MRRGLWLDDYITVHGPHSSPADCMWGEAEAIEDSTQEGGECVFETVRKIHGIHDVRGVRIQHKDSLGGELVRFPVVPMKSLTKNAKRRSRVARALHAKLSNEAIAEKRESRLLRSQITMKFFYLKSRWSKNCRMHSCPCGCADEL